MVDKPKPGTTRPNRQLHRQNRQLTGKTKGQIRLERVRGQIRALR
jgi:hypothetical protein